MSDSTKALRAVYSALAAAHEFLSGVAQDAIKLTPEDWAVIRPIHESAMKLAEETLDEIDRVKYDAEEPLGIKRWLLAGEFEEEEDGLPENTNQLYYRAGELLDASCSQEIFGRTLFEGENGKYYEMQVEGVLIEAHPDVVREALAADTPKPGVDY